jgi:uncharacterized alpha-E superfamily protein
MCRYVERAENLARFVDVTFNLQLDLPSGAREQWLPLVSTTGDNEYFAEHYDAPTRENVVEFLSFDADYPNSIYACIRSARENARTVRETISSEMWEHLNNFYYLVRGAAETGQGFQAPQEFFQEVKLASHLFNGITDGTMSHGEGWQFARLGRKLERADKTSRLLDVKYFLLLPQVHDVGTPADDLQWSAVLRSVSGFEMFRKRHGQITPDRVVGFLILDRLFPRAVMHCVDYANEALHAVSGSPEGTFWNPAEKQLGQLRSELAYLNVEEIIARGLHEFLDRLQVKLNRVGDAIHQTFFSGAADGNRRTAFVA